MLNYTNWPKKSIKFLDSNKKSSMGWSLKDYAKHDVFSDICFCHLWLQFCLRGGKILWNFPLKWKWLEEVCCLWKGEMKTCPLLGKNFAFYWWLTSHRKLAYPKLYLFNSLGESFFSAGSLWMCGLYQHNYTIGNLWSSLFELRNEHLNYCKNEMLYNIFFLFFFAPYAYISNLIVLSSWILMMSCLFT